MNTAQISNPAILIKPSDKLRNYIRNVKISKDMPVGIRSIVFKNEPNDASQQQPSEAKFLLTSDDKDFIKTLNLKPVSFSKPLNSESVLTNNVKLVNLQDLHWLYDYIQKENEQNETKVYLHELFEGSEIIMPKNEQVPRSKELEKRCVRLKAEQENRDYQNMTKNVDSTRRRLPEDTLSYQLKQMNRHLIAIFQFIVSVAAGFAFGFIGVELLIGSLDFGFRLLLGIICSLTIALAELYFLAKRLNEDLQIEYVTTEKRNKNIKID